MRKLILIATILLMSGKCFSQNVTQSQLRKALDTMQSKRSAKFQQDSLYNSLPAIFTRYVNSNSLPVVYLDTLYCPLDSIRSFDLILELKDSLGNVGSAKKFVTIKNIGGSIKFVQDIYEFPYRGDAPVLGGVSFFATQVMIGKKIQIWVRASALPPRQLLLKYTKTPLTF